MTKLQQTLGNANLSDEDKRRGVASIIQAATVSQQMSQNYQKALTISRTDRNLFKSNNEVKQ